MKKYSIAVYGGAFNPPHPGHTTVIESLLDQAEKILVVPSFCHPFGKVMTEFDTRVEWLNMMVKPFPKSRVIVSRIEQMLSKTNKPVFSIDLLTHLRKHYRLNGKEIALVMGEDNDKIFPTFYGYKDIMEGFSIIVAEERLHLHSTMIRSHINQHKNIPKEWMLDGLTLDDYQELIVS